MLVAESQEEAQPPQAHQPPPPPPPPGAPKGEGGPASQAVAHCCVTKDPVMPAAWGWGLIDTR